MLKHVLCNINSVISDYKIATSFTIGLLIVLVTTIYSGKIAQRGRHADEYHWEQSVREMGFALDASSNKNYKRAEHLARAAVCMEPLDVQYHLTLARIYALNDKVDQSRAEQEIARRIESLN